MGPDMGFLAPSGVRGARNLQGNLVMSVTALCAIATSAAVVMALVAYAAILARLESGDLDGSLPKKR